jgi:hypothetical protein
MFFNYIFVVISIAYIKIILNVVCYFDKVRFATINEMLVSYKFDLFIKSCSAVKQFMLEDISIRMG